MDGGGSRRPKQPREDDASWSEPWYPHEDVAGTDMFQPFFRRRRTWLVMIGLAGLIIAAVWLRPKLPGDAALDANQVGIGLGIFICIAFLWLTEALPLAATALLVPLVAVVTGVMDVKSALADFANPLIFLFFGGFALASAMSYQGLDRWIANRIASAGRGSFLRISFLLFGVTALLSMWMSNTATTAMMMPLVLGILGRTATPENESNGRNAPYLLLGVAYSASVGGIGTLVGSPPNGIAAQKLGISFGEWLRFGVPAVIVLLPLMVLVLWYVFRPDATREEEVRKDPFVFTWHRVVTLAVFATTALCWMFGAPLGKWLGIAQSMDTVVALTAVLALLFFRVVRWRDIDRGTDWGVLLLFGGGITLSEVLGKTGASMFLAMRLSSLVDSWPGILVIGAVIAFVIFLTELSSNTATAALMVPVFYAVGTELGMGPDTLVIPLALAASCAFMLPVATPPNAIVFGTGRVRQREMMRAGLALNLAFIVALTLLAQLVF